MSGPSLTPQDLSAWSEVAAESNTPSHFPNWLETRLLPLFGCSKAICARGKVVAGQVRVSHWLTIGYLPEQLQTLPHQFEWRERGCLHWWLQHRLPFVLDRLHPQPFATELELQEMDQLGLHSIIGHGLVSHLAKEGTYFSLGNSERSLRPQLLPLMEMAMPVLHARFTDFIHQRQPNLLEMEHLPLRQREVLRYLLDGLSDKEIAQRMNNSEKTVRNQLSELYRLYEVGTRTQLIAKLR